jgi:TetR/AcrR family transcriptional regulator, tetracycline repressor protein
MPGALTRDKVVRAALRLLDKVGLEGLTLRKLAAELRVQAPALYWHFKNKQELLDEMATSVLTEAIEEILPGQQGDWQDWAMHLGHGIRRMLLRHRDGAKMVSGTYLTNSALYVPFEAALRRLVDAGFTVRDAIRIYRTIYCYAVGFTIEEQAVYPRPGKRDPRYDIKRRAARMFPAEQFPLALAAGEEMFDSDRQFQQGLQLIVRGLRSPRRRAAAPAVKSRRV